METLKSLEPKQPHVVATLRAAATSGRMHHAYLLVGGRAALLRDLALAAAGALVCASPDGGSGCGACPACKKLAAGNHSDVIHVAPNDKGIIAIDTVREAAARLSLTANESKVKVMLVEQADRMNGPAQNAILKTLEEPPGASCFFLTASRYRALLPTVRSRVQRLRLAPSADNAGALLAAAGIPGEAAPMLGALVGADTERAQELVDAGAADILRLVRQALAPATETPELLEIAGDLGGDRDRADLALSLVEVELRDRLAARFGASPVRLHGEAAAGATRGAALASAVDRVLELRRLEAFHVNRTLALEGLFLTLRGELGPA